MVCELCDEEEDRPLYHAARLENEEMCEILIHDFKLDVNLTAKSGKTSLCFAAYFGNSLVVNVLINSGADLHVTDVNGFSPLHHAVIGDKSRAIELLLMKGAQVDVHNFTGSPLLLATLHGHTSCMEVLLNRNSDPNELLCGVVTPLLLAVMNNKNCKFHPLDKTKEIVEHLIKAGADVNKIPVLSLAYHSKELMEYFLESGANPNLPDKSGRLTIEIATMRGKSEVVEMLLPVTSPIPTMPDWTIGGLVSHVTSDKFVNEWKVLSNERLLNMKKRITDLLFEKEYLAVLVLCNYAIEEYPENVNVYYAKRCFYWMHLGNALHKMYVTNATTDANLFHIPEVISMLGKEHLFEMLSFRSYLNLLFQ